LLCAKRFPTESLRQEIDDLARIHGVEGELMEVAVGEIHVKAES
jgi:hypothetical protein